MCRKEHPCYKIWNDVKMYLEKALEMYTEMIFWLYGSINSRWGGSFIGNLFSKPLEKFNRKFYFLSISGLYKCVCSTISFTDFRDATVALEWFVKDYKTPFHLLQWIFRVFDQKGR